MKVCFQVTFPTAFRNPWSEKCDSSTLKGVDDIFFVPRAMLVLALKIESAAFNGRLTFPRAFGLGLCADKSVTK